MPTPLKQDPMHTPKHPPTPRDPYILDPIKKTPTVKDPPFQYTHEDPEVKSKLTGQPNPFKRKSSELLIRNPEILLLRSTSLLISHHLANRVQLSFNSLNIARILQLIHHSQRGMTY